VEGLEWITHGERAPHHIIFSFLRFSQEGGANPLGGELEEMGRVSRGRVKVRKRFG
jgi:hypothetical protein